MREAVSRVLSGRGAVHAAVQVHLGTLRAEDLASPCDSAEPRRSTGTASQSRTDVRLEVCAARAPYVSCGRCGAILCARRQPVSKIGRGPAARVGIVAMGV